MSFVGRRFHINLRRPVFIYGMLTTILVVIFLLSTRKLFIQYLNDRRCLNELRYRYKPVVIEPGTKEELIQRFLNVYDLDIENAPKEDGGKLSDGMMTCRQVNPDHSSELAATLKWLSTVKITQAFSSIDGKAEMDMHTGHSAKFQFILEGGYKALFKIQHFRIDQISGNLEEGSLGGERHTGEIASYHLQRILGFNRAPITVGRKVDILKEILPVADELTKNNTAIVNERLCIGVTKTKAVGNQETKHSLMCGRNGHIEGSMILWIPREMRTTPYVNPMKEKYHNERFLVEGMKYPIANETTKLLDYIDTLIFDYLVQNGDRHVFYFDPAIYSSLLILDNGKSFSNPHVDANVPLRVFSHLCQIRKSTYKRLQLLRNGVLSAVLRQILSRDPVAPILWEEHYAALDRRLNIVMKTIEDCISTKSKHYVLIDDDFSEVFSTFGALNTMGVHYWYDPNLMN